LRLSGNDCLTFRGGGYFFLLLKITPSAPTLFVNHSKWSLTYRRHGTLQTQLSTHTYGLWSAFSYCNMTTPHQEDTRYSAPGDALSSYDIAYVCLFPVNLHRYPENRNDNDRTQCKSRTVGRVTNM